VSTVVSTVVSTARERAGWVFYDWANQVFSTSVVTVFLSLYLTSVAEADAQASGQPCSDPNALVQCDVSLFGIPVAAGSVFGYLISLATVLQVLVLPVVGASIVVCYAFLPELADADERDVLSARGWAFGYLGGGLALIVHLREARRFPLTLAFLGAYLIFADGINTVAQIAGLYGERELLLPREVLIATILLVQFVAYGGAVAHGLLAARFGARRTILGSLVAWTVITTLAYFVTAGSTVEFIAVAIGIGLVLGGTLALTRSLYSQLIPPGKEAEYFALYEIGEEGTSWIGPLVFSAVAGATGSFRPAIISLIAFFVVGGVAMAFVPLRRAIRAAGNDEPALV